MTFLTAKRTVSVGLSLVLFATQVVFGNQAESNFWADRRHRTQVAALPTPSSPLSAMGAGFPSVAPLNPAVRSAASAPSSALTPIVNALPRTNVTVQEIYAPKDSKEPPVIVLQDVHLNDEAQTNLAAALQGLIDAGVTGLVGVEGAFTPLDFRPFRAFREKERVRSIAGAFLQKHMLAAPSVVGITSEAEPPPFTGVDDRAHYDANVKAYLDARAKQPAAITYLDGQERALRDEKRKVFSPAVQRFDDLRVAFRADTMGLGKYVEGLAAIKELPPLSTLARFDEAYRIERSLNFASVDAQRQRVLEQLARVLKKPEIERLISESLDVRTGRLSLPAYFTLLKHLCAEKGVTLRDTPAFEKYLQYVALADGINTDALFDELSAHEASIISKTANADEKRLLARSDRLSFLRKLAGFALTPKEWSALQNEPKDDLTSDRWTPFESFYANADARSAAMLDNLRRASPASRKAAALVTGGFHTLEITELLRARRAPFVVVAPRITKIETAAGSEYLSAFARDKTPIEKLFQGQKLFLAPESQNIAHAPTAVERLAEVDARVSGQADVTVVSGDHVVPVTVAIADPADPSRDTVTPRGPAETLPPVPAGIKSMKEMTAPSPTPVDFLGFLEPEQAVALLGRFWSGGDVPVFKEPIAGYPGISVSAYPYAHVATWLSAGKVVGVSGAYGPYFMFTPPDVTAKLPPPNLRAGSITPLEEAPGTLSDVFVRPYISLIGNDTAPGTRVDEKSLKRLLGRGDVRVFRVNVNGREEIQFVNVSKKSSAQLLADLSNELTPGKIFGWIVGVQWENLIFLIVPLARVAGIPGLDGAGLILGAVVFARMHPQRRLVLFSVGLLIGSPFLFPEIGLPHALTLSIAFHAVYNGLVLRLRLSSNETLRAIGGWLPLAQMGETAVAESRLETEVQKARALKLIGDGPIVEWTKQDLFAMSNRENRFNHMAHARVADLDQRLSNVFANEANLRRVLSLATYLKRKTPPVTDEPPLAYAIRNGLYVDLGNGAYLTPVSAAAESFIVFKMDQFGVRSAIELQVPATRDAAPIDPRSYDIASKLSRIFSEDDTTEAPLGTVRLTNVESLYGEAGLPLAELSVFVTEYRNDAALALTPSNQRDEDLARLIARANAAGYAPALTASQLRTYERDGRRYFSLAPNFSAYSPAAAEPNEAVINNMIDTPEMARLIKIYRLAFKKAAFQAAIDNYFTTSHEYREERTLRSLIADNFDDEDAMVAFLEVIARVFPRSSSSNTPIFLNSLIGEILRTGTAPRIALADRFARTLAGVSADHNFAQGRSRGLDKNDDFLKNPVTGAPLVDTRLVAGLSPNLRNVLFDEKNLNDVLVYASALRLSFSFQDKSKDALPPLAYAQQAGLTFALGNNVFIAATTQSFRRFILFEKDELGNIISRVEIKIPGHYDHKEEVHTENYTVAEELYASLANEHVVEPPIALIALQDFPPLYGQRAPRSVRGAVFVTSYERDANRMGNLFNLGNLSLSEREDLTRQYVTLLAKVHAFGFTIGADSGPGNMRAIREDDGKWRVIFCGDFEDYDRRTEKDRLTDLDKELRSVMALLKLDKARQNEFVAVYNEVLAAASVPAIADLAADALSALARGDRTQALRLFAPATQNLRVGDQTADAPRQFLERWERATSDPMFASRLRGRLNRTLTPDVKRAAVRTFFDSADVRETTFDADARTYVLNGTESDGLLLAAMAVTGLNKKTTWQIPIAQRKAFEARRSELAGLGIAVSITTYDPAQPVTLGERGVLYVLSKGLAVRFANGVTEEQVRQLEQIVPAITVLNLEKIDRILRAILVAA